MICDVTCRDFQAQLYQVEALLSIAMLHDDWCIGLSKV